MTLQNAWQTRFFPAFCTGAAWGKLDELLKIAGLQGRCMADKRKRLQGLGAGGHGSRRNLGIFSVDIRKRIDKLARPLWHCVW